MNAVELSPGAVDMSAKRRDRPYQPGRGYDWLKTKCVKNDEFVIGGYSEPTGSRAGFSALLAVITIVGEICSRRARSPRCTCSPLR